MQQNLIYPHQRKQAGTEYPENVSMLLMALHSAWGILVCYYIQIAMRCAISVSHSDSLNSPTQKMMCQKHWYDPIQIPLGEITVMAHPKSAWNTPKQASMAFSFIPVISLCKQRTVRQ